ncbi:conjugative transfer relaxase/helicase TraI [Candidatus Fukatsuia symbiotica]|uniref:conjugative transfer relaxase/helicase TraI n=1 Tax=Candidatus Fukatsuia symbiotica TaxID=1878942 RepID=UPI0019683681|nr:conjugative transfer relaxase/helicase TraI [Candidatus Fukatsuia symbiotica]
MALIGGDPRFIEAHHAAVSVAMQEVETLSCARITKDKKTATVLTGNIIAALYHHDTSRDLDPQLHTHVLVLNATYAEGKWRALASDTKMKTGFSETVMVNQVALGNIYRHSLRQAVEKMGYKTHETGKNGLWEMEGVPVTPFSQRSQTLRGTVENDASLRSRDIAALNTRKAKVASDPLILVAEWKARLQETGFNLADFISRAKAHQQEKQTTGRQENKTITNDISQVINHAISLLNDSKIQFTYSDLLAKTVGQLPAEPGVFERVRQGIEAAIEQQRVIPLDKEKGIFTSDIHLLNELSIHQLAKTTLRENRVLSFLDRAQVRERPYADAWSVLAQDKSPVAILSGQGGAAVWRERITEAVMMTNDQGREVRILAADRRSGAWLAQDKHIAGRVMVRSQLTGEFALLPQSTLVIDQAEKLTLKETLLLLEKGQEQSVQLLFINSEQRPGTGNALSVLKEAGVPHYQLYGSQPLATVVVSESDKRIRYEVMASEYAAMKSAKTEVVAQVNGQREQATLTAAIRTQLKGSGQLGEVDTTISVLHPVWLDRKSRHQRENYRAGMVMEQWDNEKKTMHRYQIDRVIDSTNTLQLTSETGHVRAEKINKLDSSWSLFAQKQMTIAVGEQLRAVGREMKGKIKAHETLKVTAISKTGVTVERQGNSFTLDRSRALKLLPDYVESVGASVSDKNQILAAFSARDLNAATLNQLARSGDKATLYTAMPLDRVEKRLASHPHYRLASEQVKAQAGMDNLDKAIRRNRENLLSPVQQSVALGLSRVQTQGIAFSDLTLISASLGWSPEVTVNQIKAEIEQQKKQGDLISLSPIAGVGTGLLVSRVTYEMEKSILRTIAQGKNAVPPLMAAIPQQYLEGLTDGQKAATSMILKSADQFLAIQGFAGTGKTTQFKAVMAAIDSLPENQRPQMMGLAPTHRAVHEMQGAGICSQTLASFLSEARQQALAGEAPDYHNTVFIIDESSMIGNRDMAELYQQISRGHGRAISSGDSAQLQAIAPGQPFKLMQQRSAIDIAIMKDIVRQTPALKTAIYSMIEGNTREALNRIETVTPDRIPRQPQAWIPTASVIEFKQDQKKQANTVSQQKSRAAPIDVISAISQDYTGRTVDTRNHTLIVAHLNDDRHAINAQIHQQLQAAGELGHTEYLLSILEPVRILHHELRRAKGFSVHVNNIVLMNNQYYTVAKIDDKAGVVTLRDSEGKAQLISNFENSTEAIALYKPREILVSTGDKLRFTRSDNDRGYVANSLWQVSKIENNGSITLTDGEHNKHLDPKQAIEDRHIDLAYAVTSYGAQGASSRYVITLEGTERGRKNMATREGGYVTLSRAKEHVQVYTDDREKWLRALEQQKKYPTAHDLLHSADDKAAQIAARLMASATPMQNTALGRKLLQTRGLGSGESMAKLIVPGRQYPTPHMALPVWDSNGKRAGVYLDEIRLQQEGSKIELNHQPRVLGSQDARFAGLQISRNGETRLAADIHQAIRLAHVYPESGVIIRLSGVGIPSNVNRITGNILVPEDETTRQAQTPPDDPLPFIHDDVEKYAAEQEKKARDIAQQQPEQENQAIAIEKAAKIIQEEAAQNALKSMKSDPSSKDNGALNKVVQDVAQTTLSSERLQKLERDIVKEKTFEE